MEFIESLLYNTWSLLKSVSCWMMFSFLLAGMLHNFLRPEILQRNLGNKKLSSLLKATISGAFLPICSCGVIPLGLSLYYSGAYLGNVLAFMIATPIINPAAVLISLATLGPRITAIYVAAGLFIPIIVGSIGNYLGGNELMHPMAATLQQQAGQSDMPKTAKPSFIQRVVSGLKWGFFFLGKEISQYIVPGALLAAFILTIVPMSFIQRYLSRPDMVSILGIAVLGAIMYVCAVGHIPFIGALIGAGAAPGVAITFLITGTATNLPEIISIHRMIGKRTVLIYCTSMVIIAVLLGYLTNLILVDFVPVFDVSINQGKLDLADKLSVSFPNWLESICALIIIAFCVWARWPKFKKILIKQV